MVAEPEEIKNHIIKLNKESSDLEQQITELSIYSGSVSYGEAWALSYKQRESIVKTINKKNKEESGDKTEYM